MTTLDLLNEGQAHLHKTDRDGVLATHVEYASFLTFIQQVEHLGCAPLGDPIEFLIRGYRLSLRATEASRVIVERIV